MSFFRDTKIYPNKVNNSLWTHKTHVPYPEVYINITGCSRSMKQYKMRSFCRIDQKIRNYDPIGVWDNKKCIWHGSKNGFRFLTHIATAIKSYFWSISKGTVDLFILMIRRLIIF